MSNGEVGISTPKKLPRPNNIIKIPTTSELDFFKKWCIYIRPLIPLTDREIDVVAEFLRQRWLLTKEGLDSSVVDTIMRSKDMRKKVIDACNMSIQHYYVIMGNLRRNNVITKTGINPRLIPNVRTDGGGVFQLVMLFNIESSKDAV